MNTAPPSAEETGPVVPVGPAAPPGQPAPAPPAEPRRAYRDLDDHVLGGVASGLAEHLGLPVMWVRAAFVVGAVLGGIGIALYAGLWLMLPAGPAFEHDAPGLESATRGGRRPRSARRLGDIGPLVALGAFGIGLTLVVQALFGSGAQVWPVFLGVAGIALLWRQADEAQRERWIDAGGRVDPARIVLGDGGWASYARLVSGLGLVVLAVLWVSLQGGSLSVARDITIAVLLGVVGLGIVVGPWAYRLTRELSDERAERVRNQERADVAAHLHDSVLQTLALIQKNPSDAARLARAQERDLRSWLFAGEAMDDRTVASALRAAAADIEDAYGIHVDVVAVGDTDLDEATRPIVAAAREAVTNAAKHSGAARVDVYAEIGDAALEVFVRDRGSGFDPEDTPEDRFGVRHSIVDRMDRHGGSAEVRSTPGEGTEVRLRLAPPDRSHQVTAEEQVPERVRGSAARDERDARDDRDERDEMDETDEQGDER
ncbi:PspC domain-containing protein [Nocardioides sp. GY 10113]|uniref:PspC domain-containing protein n=1 Tax=Nocardioides sp. GY 10113 TaxID=2569761 RepID=UPI0010A790A8|nr:PspC domain-containing protein [Nocardioides sp. GY 10113]TIC86270.1 PspC domain-containing protein [Nocardioides sp. GY 10113]